MYLGGGYAMKKRISLLLCIILVFALAITGCGNQESAPSEDTGENIQEENQDFKAQMTFNGSSTLAPVMSAIATEFIEEYTTWDKVNPSFPEENIAIYVSAGGSGAGVKAALEGTSDFGMLAREIKDEEKEKLGDMEAFTLGIDALTISNKPGKSFT